MDNRKEGYLNWQKNLNLRELILVFATEAQKRQYVATKEVLTEKPKFLYNKMINKGNFQASKGWIDNLKKKWN